MARIDYYKIAAEPFHHLMEVSRYLSKCGLDQKLRALLELRVSQINGCVYCLDMHSKEARSRGEIQQRLDTLSAWHEAPYFDARERAALAWAESLTNVSETHVPDGDFNAVCEHFSEREVVDLTVCISLINAWNRIAVSSRKMPD